ncbi:hypothetical protein T069G_09962 [Trichoderma breve]|uniref:Uncharacterized protein n=1 Tax=Trichoderma breve TaxID=2034170 RepID=A0A9W9E3E3_9HYPO|nr:hypothetical protein T069G_09962 [Trichoderma breve]KAJ4856594.1 hypothetical protein T069G_09962 [Trichoderma breve]
MPSHISVGTTPLNSAGAKRTRSGSSSTGGPIKKLKSLHARFSHSLQSSASVAKFPATGSTASSGALRPDALPKENNPGAGRLVTSSTQVNAPDQQLVHQHHMHAPKEFPGATHLDGSHVYVFPRANWCIPEEYRKRYPVVMDIFQRNLEEIDLTILKHPAKTAYKLSMCGTSIDKATPSILICHPQVDTSMGQRILRHLHRPQVRKQYNSSKMAVSFEIYWYSGPAWTYLGRPIDGLNIQMESSYIWGALLLDDDHYRISTITCGIRFPNVEDAMFLLSTAHAFEENDSSGDYDEDEESVEPNGGEDGDGDIYRFGDVEYDMAEIRDIYECDKENQPPQATGQQQDRRRYTQDLYSDLGWDSGETVSVSPNRVWGRSREAEWSDSLNLDWALIEIKKSEQWKAERPRLALPDIPGSGYQERRVEVMTSRGALFGTICSIPSFIANSNKLSKLCKVWTVSLLDPSEISVGDSGALVIDCLTSKLYGYIIGINHFQELYVIPLQSVLEQITEMIPASYGNPEIFMMLDQRRTPRPPPKTSKVRGLTRYLHQYWPQRDLYNISSLNFEPRWLGDDSYDSESSSSSHYVDCPTSPMPNYPSEADTQHYSVPTSFGSYDAAITQSSATQFSSFQILNDSMDEKIENSKSPSPAPDDDSPPSSYQTAEDGSNSAPSSQETI